MKDDEQYLALMSRYKNLRRDPAQRDEAQRVLDAAMRLAQRGQVSKDALIGAAYL